MSFILLVEDAPLQVKMVTDLIKFQIGLRVVATNSTQEAFLLAQTHPLLIISDICLVNFARHTEKLNKDGIMFVQSIKAEQSTRHIPVILRSSLSLSDLNLNLEYTKANVFLNKSISTAEFVKIIKSYVRQQAACSA